MTMRKRDHPLRLKNTLTGEVQKFVPLNPPQVKLFTCGPSIYGSPHIGNYRTFLYEDSLLRYLEYLGYSVERLINFTDIEDKSVEKAGGSLHRFKAITEDAAENFYQNSGLLHIKIPDYIPRSSTSVNQAVRLIKELLGKGIAYRLGRDIFYDPLKFSGFGKLFGLDMSKWPKEKRCYRRDSYEGNRWNRGDFILWHGYRRERDGDIFWETELGKGRPAWNVQDGAMITRDLGFQIDIACGGIDNLYRHHDYTIAVIEGISGKQFASVWLHGEHVLLHGKKMSKSKGNILYPKELQERGMRAAAIRYTLLTVHYREKLNLTDKLLQEKERQCQLLQQLAGEITSPLLGANDNNSEASSHISGLTEDFETHMNDDLRFGRACDALLQRLGKLTECRNEKGLSYDQWQRIRENLLQIDSVLQILFV